MMTSLSSLSVISSGRNLLLSLLSLNPVLCLTTLLRFTKKDSGACSEQQVRSRAVGWYKKSAMECPVEEMGVGRSRISDMWSVFSLKAVSETSPGWAQVPEK